ncbi:hypothetical protein EXIGLDRAFT_128480 [Exidia glandulosa HHB12029]|uniref:Uncharacterized protein n=1 Tax=Exidia glandulosa HHB12029 TaxID=1314781 RepID=A0A165G7W0_EXIGL|nr:hypothetical protein EXIGLDRAFT_128480 [Exidia glandulosa HHB12029]
MPPIVRRLQTLCVYLQLHPRFIRMGQGWNASYTGSTVWPVIPPNTTYQPHDVGVPIGFPYRRTRVIGASVALVFQGTGFYLCFTPGGASYDFFIDGEQSTVPSSTALPAKGTSCDSSGASNIISHDGMQNDHHNASLTLRSIASSDFEFFGGGITITVDTKGAPIDDSTVIDDLDHTWTFSPGRTAVDRGWRTDSEPSGLYHDSWTWNCVYAENITASYSFSGAGGVVLNAAVWRDSRAFTITFDGAVFKSDATSHWADNTTIFFAQGNLDPTRTYNLTLTNFNADVPDCHTKDEFGQPVNRFCCQAVDSITLLRASSRYVLESLTVRLSR